MLQENVWHANPLGNLYEQRGLFYSIVGGHSRDQGIGLVLYTLQCVFKRYAISRWKKYVQKSDCLWVHLCVFNKMLHWTVIDFDWWTAFAWMQGHLFHHIRARPNNLKKAVCLSALFVCVCTSVCVCKRVCIHLRTSPPVSHSASSSLPVTPQVTAATCVWQPTGWGREREREREREKERERTEDGARGEEEKKKINVSQRSEKL